MFLFFSAIFSFCLNVASQILLHRFHISGGLLKSVYAGFLLGLLFFLGSAGLYHQVVIQPDNGMNSFATLDFFLLTFAYFIVYAILGFCYYTVIGLSETARRIRILRELANEPLSLEHFLQKYNAEYIVNIRVKRLLKSGQVVNREGHLFPHKPVVLWMARCILLAKKIIQGKQSEFGDNFLNR